MTAYTLRSAGTFASTIVGGDIVPGMPTFNAGDLLLLMTGANSTTLGVPTLTGWTQFSTATNAKCAAFFGRIAVNGDTAPTVHWDASHAAYADIAAFSGDVYTDLSTIVSAFSDRGTNAQGKVAVPGLTPADNNCLVLRGGHCTKTSLNNSASFGDWATVSGVFTKIAEKVQSNSNLGAVWWYEQQTTATNRALDSDPLPTTDTNNNTQGWAIALKTQAAVIITPTRGLLGVGV